MLLHNDCSDDPLFAEEGDTGIAAQGISWNPFVFRLRTAREVLDNVGTLDVPRSIRSEVL